VGEAAATILAVSLYAATLMVCWVLTLFGLPGTWLIVVAAGVYSWLMPDDTRWDVSWQLVVVLAAMAVVAEIYETAAAARGTRKLGGSRRGAVLAIVGSIIGAIVGTMVIPIPVVGTIVGACLGAALGAGAGELHKGRDTDHAWKIGKAAFQGRLVGSLAKLLIAAAMVAGAGGNRRKPNGRPLPAARGSRKIRRVPRQLPWSRTDGRRPCPTSRTG
jgi:uncharacterized protein YqgC (DUF456 family)